MISFPWSRSRYLLGINIGIKSATAVLVEQNRDGNRPTKYIKMNYPTSLTGDEDYQSLSVTLQSVVDNFKGELASDCVPIQLALADTLVSSAVFELDQMPRNVAMKNQLLAMRFQKECHINTQNADIVSQVVQKNKRPALYGMTAPAALISLIKTTLKHRHQNLQRIDKAIHYVFNYYYEQLSADAAMLFIDDEYWSLIIWDSAKNVVYFRSKLQTDDNQLISIADDVLRLLHTYQQTDQQMINQLYVVNTGHLNKGFSEIIAVRGKITVSPLTLVSQTHKLELPDNELALFAAQPR